MSDIQIIQGDCLEVMKTFDDNQFDLVLTDPPYGIKEARNDNASRGRARGGLNNNAMGYSKDYPIEAWDDSPPSQAYFDEMLRIGQEQIIFGANHFSDKLPRSSCWIVWDKDNGNNDFADCELAWASYKKAVRKFVWRWHGLFQEDMKNKEERFHRNQKPSGLFAQILERYTNEGDTVLDPFLGSGTTAVACERMGRNCVGIEISEEYCNIARKRVQEEKDKMGLFSDL